VTAFASKPDLVGVTTPIQMLDAVAENSPLEAELTEAFLRVLRSGRYILGEEVDRFEARCADYLGVEHAIGISSGTDALLLALMALGIGEGDEVLCPAFTFFATAGSIARLGARPVFVDVDENSFNLDVGDAERRITDKTRAIIPVHLYGRAAQMNAIVELAEKHDLAIVEDAAQAFGSRLNGQAVGSFGEFGAFSFYPTKNLGAFGDAGMLVTNEPQLAEMARCLRVHGGHRRYYHDFVGGNFRLDALQAALLSAKLDVLDQQARRRCENAEQYGEMLTPAAGRCSDLLLPESGGPGEHVWNQYTIRLRGTGRRDALREHLERNQVSSEIYYPLPLHQQGCFAEFADAACPVSERLSHEVLSLPNHPNLAAADIGRISELISRFTAGAN
jgi:dTDP-4-amino-4,6-dideoxygalactose transaminase